MKGPLAPPPHGALTNTGGPTWMTCSAQRRAAGPLPAEEGLHEAVDVPVEDGLHVARLVTGAEVLHLLVRRLDVRPDLVAHRRLVRPPRDALQLGPTVLPLALRQLGPQDLHGPLLVLVLAALVLAGHDDARRQVGDAHGRIRDVDVLAAGSRRPVG